MTGFRNEKGTYCGVQNYSVSGFIIFELFTVNFFRDWAGWGIFAVIPGNPRRTKGDSQHLEACPELQDCPQSELFTVKNSRTGPFSNYLGNNFELYSKHKSFWPVTPPVTGGSPDREARGQSFMCYPRNPRNINLFVRMPDREDR